MNKEQFLTSGLLEQYVLGLTTPRENEVVEDFISRYPELKAELLQLQKAMERYAMQHVAPPPPGLKQKLMSSLVDPDPMPRIGPRPRPLARVVTALGLVGCLAFFVLALLQYQTAQSLRGEKEKLANQFAAFQQECESQKQQFQQYAAQMEFLRHPDTRQVRLSGTDLASGAVATVFWNTEQKEGMVHLGTLPPPPPGKIYQIWADVEGKMLNAGILTPEAHQQLVAIDFIEKAESLNITLEPAGGSEEPTVALLQANGEV